MNEMDKEKRFKNRIDDYLNSNYKGNFRSSVNLNYEKKTGDIFVTFHENENMIKIGEFVEMIVSELDIEVPDTSAELDLENKEYQVSVTEKDYKTPKQLI